DFSLFALSLSWYVPPVAATLTLSLHDALPISWYRSRRGRVNPRRLSRTFWPASGSVTQRRRTIVPSAPAAVLVGSTTSPLGTIVDRKSTRLNSSHGSISYAVFCLKKKK